MKRVFMTTDAVGGVWTYTCELVQAFSLHGIEATVAIMGSPPTPEQTTEISAGGNVTLHHAPFALEWQPDPWKEVDEASTWLLDLAYDAQPDVIHVNGFVHGNLPWEAPVVIVAHSCVLTWWRDVHHTDAPSSWAEYRCRVGEGLCAAACVITPTHAFRKSFEREHGMQLRGATIYNGRDPQRFRPDMKDPIIFSAGRLWDPAKNVEMLGKIAPRLEWPLHLAGQSSGPSSIPRGARYLGSLSARQMAAQLGRAGIYASPARYEPFGLSILEAALSGCALLLGDIPSLREIWDGCAIFVDPDDEASWAESLNQLASDHGRREDLQARALQRARCLTPEVQAAAYLQVYRDLRPAHTNPPQLARA